jgi:hypothetical protein
VPAWQLYRETNRRRAGSGAAGMAGRG